MNKTIYNYHPQTSEFINEAPADASPLEPDVILIPAFSTTVKPPKTAAREVAVFADGQWQAKADWRGVGLFSTTDGSSMSISEIGKTPADVGATDKAMPSAAHSWKDGAWALDPVKVAGLLDAAKTNALDRIDAYGKAQRVKIAKTSDALQLAGWNVKVDPAKRVVGGTASDMEVLSFQQEADQRHKGESAVDLAKKVLRNSEYFLLASTFVDGIQSRAQDLVNAAGSPEEVEAVLAAMKSQAEAAFAQLMQAAK